MPLHNVNIFQKKNLSEFEEFIGRVFEGKINICFVKHFGDASDLVLPTNAR